MITKTSISEFGAVMLVFIDYFTAGTNLPMTGIVGFPSRISRAYVRFFIGTVGCATFRAHAGIGAQNSMRSAGIGIFCIAAAAIFPVLCFIAAGHTGSGMINRKIQTAATANIAYTGITAVYIMLFLGAGHAASRKEGPVMGFIICVNHFVNVIDPHIRRRVAAAFAYTGIRRHTRHRMLIEVLALCAAERAGIPM